MSDNERSIESKQRPRGRWFFVAAGVPAVAAVVTVAFPNLYTYVNNQVQDGLRPTDTPTATRTISAEPGSPKPSNTTRADEKLGSGRGQVPIEIEWPAFPTIHTTDIERGQSISDAPRGARSAIWTETMPGACAEKGFNWYGMHSHPGEGVANVPRDFIRQLGEKGIGSMIWIVAKDGTRCGYEVEWFESVKKRGDGKGTFRYLLTHNPTGRDLRDENGEPFAIFASCDETLFNPFNGSSDNNIIAGASLKQVEKPKEK